MKSFIIFLLFPLLIGCNSEQPSQNVSTKNHFIGLELSGCNLGDDVPLAKKHTHNSDVSGDTLIISNEGDSTSIFVCLNFICSWKFDTEYSISGDTLFLSIIDTCSNGCGAWCMCNYGFKFSFFNLDHELNVCKADFKTNRPEGPRVIGICPIF